MTGEHTLRTCAIRDEHVTVGAHNAYSRLILRDPQKLPLEFSGEIRLHDRLDGPVMIYGENRLSTWEHGLCFHPVFGVTDGEDNNLVDCAKPSYTKWGASGQINGKYGIPHTSRYQAPTDWADVYDRQWHTFRMSVPEVGVHRTFFDGELKVELVEQSPPPAFWNGLLLAGLRVDFFDVELRNLHVI